VLSLAFLDPLRNIAQGIRLVGTAYCAADERLGQCQCVRGLLRSATKESVAVPVEDKVVKLEDHLDQRMRALAGEQPSPAKMPEAIDWLRSDAEMSKTIDSLRSDIEQRSASGYYREPGARRRYGSHEPMPSYARDDLPSSNGRQIEESGYPDRTDRTDRTSRSDRMDYP
jgi:hypothetical protein